MQTEYHSERSHRLYSGARPNLDVSGEVDGHIQFFAGHSNIPPLSDKVPPQVAVAKSKGSNLLHERRVRSLTREARAELPGGWLNTRHETGDLQRVVASGQEGTRAQGAREQKHILLSRFFAIHIACRPKVMTIK